MADGAGGAVARRRWRRGSAGLVLAAVSLTGCGQGGDDAGTTTAPTTAVPTTAPETTEAPTTTASTPAGAGGTGTVKWENLDAGQCVVSVPAVATVSTVEVVDCTTGHAAEVIWSGRLSAASSGLRGKDATAESRCKAQFATYAGVPLDGSPYQVSWLSAAPATAGQRPGLPSAAQSTVVCLAGRADGAVMTASVAAG